MSRPSLAKAKKAFKEVYDNVGKTVSGVGRKIGGKVDYNINKITIGRFENACAIRLSYVLNQTGYKVPKILGETVSGQAGNWYIYRITALIPHLIKQFGKPDYVFNNPTQQKLKNHKGILVFEVSFRNATGHATIWDGVNCSDQCYFVQSKKAYLWEL